ncbi:hypothetical protein TKK_0007650 [Trichogramma kaykai]
MDSKVNELLKNWNLDQLCYTFFQHGVNYEKFCSLQEDDIKKIILDKNIRSVFQEFLKYYKLSISSEPETDTSNVTEPVVPVEIEQDVILTCQDRLEQFRNYSHLFSENKNRRLYKLLDASGDSCWGRVILYKWAHYQDISQFRKILSHIIIDKEYLSNIYSVQPFEISDKRFEQFRSEIVELFPLEPQLAYYERGAYLNKRQIFGKKAGLLDFKESDEKSQSEPKEDTVPRVTVTTTNIDCLLNVIKPDDDLSFIKNTWYSHYELRQRRYADLGFDLINTFKVLQHNICIELIDFDFNQKYKSDNLVQIKERWYGIVEAIIEIAAEKLITHTTRRDETECAFLDPEQFPYCLNKVRNKDHDKSIKTVLAVFCLPWIVDYSVRRTQVFVDWKPSACDKLNSFCLQILDHSNLDAIVTSTAENYEACGVKSPQPYVVCCGTIPNPEVLKIIFDLHKNVRFTRSDIDDIILTFSSFISYHNKLMFSQLESLLKNANDAILHEISKVFDRYKNPFELVKTCDARENLLIRLNIYKEPVEIPIATENFYKLNGTEVTTIEKPVKIVHIPLEDSLTTLLQIDGLFEAIVDYIDYLDELNVLTNFMQGDLWKKKSKHMKDENKLVLPLAFYSDDVELGNALGSHAGVNKLGANYLFLLCLPPNIASKLWSIILCDLYYAKYRKSYGNEKVFEHSIKELNRLRDKGIRVKTKSGIHHVYFLTSIISGDNLGLNGMLGFIESFYNTVFCRVCYSFPIIVSKLTKENSKLLRTVEKYEEDVKSIKTTSSGIKEPCVFNKLKDFHVIDNQSLDIMHDLYEGVCSITMANIILTLILEDELFSIDFLNARLQSIDFSFESKNVPQNISLDYLKNNGHLKMSASECLFFTRYFGIMVGFKVKEDNCAWALYLELREMVDLLTAPRLTESHLAQLETIIPNFLSSYIDLYGDLKGKFHLLIHYPRIIRANGPPTKVSTIRCESKHKVLKSIAPNASNKNTLFSVAKRYQLSVMYLKHEKYDENGITYGKKTIDESYFNAANQAQKKYVVNSIVINDCVYKKDTVILISLNDFFPNFGKIKNLYALDDDLYFEYIPLKTLGFNDHIYAYEVLTVNNCVRTVAHEDLSFRMPFLMHVNDKKDIFVAGRHIF